MKNDWSVIDCHYRFPRFAAAFLRVKNERAIFVENNTNHAIPYLIRALKDKNVEEQSVDYLIVTHAHLDHAGATAALAARCPNAVVLAHPKAAKTLTEPERLLSSAKKVYGEEKFSALYGEIKPLPKDRVREITDGERIVWQGVPLRFIFTQGHASHHLCVLDETDKSIFTGDAFGLSYPALVGRTPFHIPSTSPVDFDYEEAIRSIDQIEATKAETAYLTHFGPVTGISERAKQLKRHLLFHQSLILECDQKKIPDSEVESIILEKLSDYFDQELKACGIEITPEVQALLKMDLDLNAAGLAVACLRKRKQRAC
ncbi:MAG: MBL fold metallo-hydrolase [Proteobacteria bacterium]|nr:MBL fold metallo-hydrolase [Pseudomonadota bacterium]